MSMILPTITPGIVPRADEQTVSRANRAKLIGYGLSRKAEPVARKGRTPVVMPPSKIRTPPTRFAVGLRKPSSITPSHTPFAEPLCQYCSLLVHLIGAFNFPRVARVARKYGPPAAGDEHAHIGSMVSLRSGLGFRESGLGVRTAIGIRKHDG